MNQEEFIKSFIEFDIKCYKEGLNKTDEVIELFKIWYDGKDQKWMNIRHFNLTD